MTVIYCTSCWAENRLGDKVCRSCGGPLLDEATYVEKLIRGLRHPEPQTRVRVAWILGELKARQAVPELMAVASETEDPYLQEAIVSALGQIGDGRALPLLIQMASGPGFVRVRLAAVEALGKFADNELARRTLRGLASKEDAVGRAARRLLTVAGGS
jgi:HEAT repeat protein